MNEINIKRSELGIIHAEICQLIGYDDGTNSDVLDDRQVVKVHAKKLEFLQGILKSRKASIEFQIDSGYTFLSESLELISNRVEYFDGEL